MEHISAFMLAFPSPIDRIMRSIASCFCLSKAKNAPGFTEYSVLASETIFNVNEVEALYVLFEQLSDNGQIRKEEFLLALFNSSSKKNILAERLFELFDLERNGAIEFGEFVRSLSIFHPDAPHAEKIACTPLKKMVVATLSESELSVSEDDIEAIVNKTLHEADLNGDGRIDIEEWKELVAKYPSLVKNMTLSHLRDITLAFPSFVMETEVPDSELVC
ncbi:hypothetical protein OROGR_026909 [Orobanche gracilis]